MTNSIANPAVAAFRTLHEHGCFVLPNPWDIGTAHHLQRLGFAALATTSAGYAFTRGLRDGEVSRDEMIAHIREIVEATSLPVNADFQAAFADEAEAVHENVGLCLQTGVAGLSVEDSTGETARPLLEKNEATVRLQAARRAIDEAGGGVVLTGRCEAFLVRHEKPMAEALDRLAAYAAAGADCLYAPGLTNADEVRALVKELAPKPVNVLVSGFNAHFSLRELEDLGVRRVSVGSGLALAAWGAFLRAAEEIRKEGRFSSLGGAPKTSQVSGFDES